MFKNVASQSVTLYAVDATTGLPKTGDSANMVFYVSKDDGTVTAIAASSGVPTEADATNAKGDYKIALSQAETNADKLRFTGKSSTANVVVVPATIYTAPANFTKFSVDSNGRVDVINVNGQSQTARDLGASVLLSPGTGTGQISLASGAVTVGTNNDKTGYALTQAFPTNFAALGISAAGKINEVVSVDTLTTYTNNTPQTGDSYPIVHDATNGNVAIKTAVAAIPTNPLTSLGTNAPANWINAAAVASGALDGKGDWLLASGYTAPDNADIAAIKAKTDNLPGDPSSAATVAAAFAVVDAAIAALAATSLLNTTWTDAKAAFLDTAISSVGGGGQSSDPYLAARIYGRVSPEDGQGRQVFYSPPNAIDGGNVAKVRFSRTNPKGGRLVELDPVD